ncbi:MAG: EamA family transporter [Peptococcaceae bacterium]|nr:EamA family transporter [Peptococcaceae bacterium]
MTTERKKQGVGILQVFMAAVLWGTAGTFAKYLFNNQISPFDLAQVRLTLAFIFLVGFITLFDRRLLRIDLRDLPYFIIFGIVGLALNQFTYLFTISLTNVATAIFLQYLGPALILIYGLLTKTEKPKKLKFIALAASVLGGYLIVLGTSTGLGLSTLGLISGLASAFVFAFYSVYGKYGLAKYSAWTLLVWGFGFGTLAWSLYQFPWVTIANNQSALPEFLYIAVLATAVPFGLYFQGLKNLSAFKTGLIATLEPVVGAFSAFLILGEILNWIQLLGCAFVLIGVVLIQAKQVEN